MLHTGDDHNSRNNRAETNDKLGHMLAILGDVNLEGGHIVFDVDTGNAVRTLVVVWKSEETILGSDKVIYSDYCLK